MRPRNDRDFCKECGARQAGDREGRPYESVTRGAVRRRGEGTPLYNSNFCRAGPVCPADAAEKESPSHGFAVQAPFRQGGL